MCLSDEIKEFNEYRKFVKFLAEKKIPLMFPNSSSKHAAVVLSSILDTSNEVYIYDDNLNGDIAYEHEDFMDSLKRFCSTNENILKVVIKPFENSNDQKLFSHIKKMVNKGNTKATVEIYTYNDGFVNNMMDITKKLFDFDGNINFTVGDNSYRIEKFPDDYNYEALCNLYDPIKSNELKKAYINNLKNCDKVIL